MSSSSVADGVSITEQASRFVHITGFSDIPTHVVRLGKKAILDCIGVALAGAQSEGSKIVRRHIDELRSLDSSATVIGTDVNAPPRFAALANANSMHSDDYDDTYHPSRIHPSAAVMAASLAEAERIGCSGRDFLAAFNVGVEVSCKVSEAIDGQHYQRGYHSTGTCGVFGAAAAVCNLRRLPVETVRMALGIAGSEAAGLRENFGTMVKPFHAGRAAENGLVAASLAAAGFTAAPTALEGKRGFFMAAGGGYDCSIIDNRLGAPWTFSEPGIAIKPFPSGALTHPAMSKMRELVLEHDITCPQVERVRIRTNRLLPENLTYHRPVTGLQGKFSMEFCIASILVLRRAGLAEFTDAIVNRADVQEAISKIDYSTYSDDEASANRYQPLTTFLDIVMKDGRTIAARADIAKGNPRDPMSHDAVAAKFLECAAFASWPGRRAEKIIEITNALEKFDNVHALTSLLCK